MKKLVCLLALFLALGCGKKRDIIDDIKEDKVIMVKDDDPAMLAAIKKAGDTVNQDFIPHLQKPGPKMGAFAIKYPFKDGKEVEHMWIGELTFANGKFSGVVNNEPNNVKNVKLGQKVTVAPNEISDWMFVDDGHLRGGYTLRVMRDNLSAEDRKKFDEGMPFKID